MTVLLVATRDFRDSICHDAAMADAAEVPIRLRFWTYGSGRSDFVLQISARHWPGGISDVEEELRDWLVTSGLEASFWDFGDPTGGAFWQVLIAAVSSGGAITALSVALQKYIERQKDKKFVLRNGDSHLDISGYSAKELERILLALREDATRDSTPIADLERPDRDDPW